MDKKSSDMNPFTRTVLGYLAMAALIAGIITVLSPSANATNATGNAYGKDNNPGRARGHALDGGPTDPGSAASAQGQMASAMGSLNAAHASAQGLKHANDRSVVGTLAAYMEAMVTYEKKDEEYHDLYNQIAAVDQKIDVVDGKISDIDGDIDAIDADISTLEGQIDSLNTEDESYDANKASLELQISDLVADKLALEGDKTLQEAEKSDLEGEKAELEADLVTVTAELNDAVHEAAANLKQAANKDSEIDATVVNAVNGLLDGKSEDFTHSQSIREMEDDIALIIKEE